MGVNLGKLTAYITADSTGFASGMTRAVGSLSQLQMKARSISGSIAGAFMGLRGLGAMIVSGLGVSQIIGAMDVIQDRAEQLGVSAGKLHALSGAAATSGTSLESVAKAMARISKTAGEGDPLALLQGVAEKVANAKSPAQALAIAMKNLGKAGAEMVPFLKELNANPPLAALDDQKIKQIADIADSWSKIKHNALTITVKAMTAGGGGGSGTGIIESALAALADPVGVFSGASTEKNRVFPTSPLVLRERREKRAKANQLGQGFFDAVAGPFMGQAGVGAMPEMFRKFRDPKLIGPTMELMRWSAASDRSARDRRTDFRTEALTKGSRGASDAIAKIIAARNDKQLAVQIESKAALQKIVGIMGGLSNNLGLAVIGG